MTKQELLDFLEPFSGDIKIVVRGANKNLTAPVTQRLEYLTATNERPAIIAINLESAIAVNTGFAALSD